MRITKRALAQGVCVSSKDAYWVVEPLADARRDHRTVTSETGCRFPLGEEPLEGLRAGGTYTLSASGRLDASPGQTGTFSIQIHVPQCPTWSHRVENLWSSSRVQGHSFTFAHTFQLPVGRSLDAFCFGCSCAFLVSGVASLSLEKTSLRLDEEETTLGSSRNTTRVQVHAQPWIRHALLRPSIVHSLFANRVFALVDRPLHELAAWSSMWKKQCGVDVQLISCKCDDAASRAMTIQHILTHPPLLSSTEPTLFLGAHLIPRKGGFLDRLFTGLFDRLRETKSWKLCTLTSDGGVADIGTTQNGLCAVSPSLVQQWQFEEKSEESRKFVRWTGSAHIESKDCFIELGPHDDFFETKEKFTASTTAAAAADADPLSDTVFLYIHATCDEARTPDQVNASLATLIEQCRRQTYGNWRLCVSRSLCATPSAVPLADALKDARVSIVDKDKSRKASATHHHREPVALSRPRTKPQHRAHRMLREEAGVHGFALFLPAASLHEIVFPNEWFLESMVKTLVRGNALAAVHLGSRSAVAVTGLLCQLKWKTRLLELLSPRRCSIIVPSVSGGAKETGATSSRRIPSGPVGPPFSALLEILNVLLFRNLKKKLTHTLAECTFALSNTRSIMGMYDTCSIETPVTQ